MKLRFLSRITIRVLEILSLFALLGTSEIHPIFLGGTIAIGLLVGVFSVKREHSLGPLKKDFLPKPLPMLTLGKPYIFFGIVFGASLSLTIFRHLSPLVVASYALPVTQVFIWLQLLDLRAWGWRLVIAFFELVLTVTLTPQFYLAGVLFVFLVMGSVATCCLFMEAEYREHRPEEANPTLPSAFFFQSVVGAIAVLAASLMLFPALPRPDANYAWTTQAKSSLGYTEDIEIGSKQGFDNLGGGRPVLRVFLPSDFRGDLNEFFPLGLIRGRSLNRLTESGWKADSNDPATPSAPPPDEASLKQLEFLREPIGYDTLPLPYGGWTTRTGTAGVYLKYNVTLAEFSSMPGPANSVDREVPTLENEPEIQRLADRIFRATVSESAKISAIRTFFKQEGFRVSYTDGPQTSTGSWIYTLREFLFKMRAGHCELFSTAAAVLLRVGGVPARLVSGFRISHKPVSNILTVREGDAHAWVEVFITGRGWIPFDPTPAIQSVEGGGLARLRNLGDYLAAHWYRVVIGFDQESINWRWLALTFGAALVALSIVWLIMRHIRRFQLIHALHSSRTTIPLALERRRIRLFLRRRNLGDLDEAIEQCKTKPECHKFALSLTRTRDLYWRLRFGPDGPHTASWKKTFAELRDERILLSMRYFFRY